MTDESAIRELQQTWFRAAMEGDSATIKTLMTDDIVFLSPGRPPFGKAEFMDSFEAMKDQVAMTCRGEYEEVIVTGDLAYARARLEVNVTPKNGGKPMDLSGYTLSVFKRNPNGPWQLCRDANLIAPVSN